MNPIKLPGILALVLLTSLYGCVTTGPASAVDEEDEYEGRFFSWEFEVEPDSPPSEQPPSKQSPATDAKSSASATPSTSDAPPAKQPIRIRYSTEDDENGDRGFIIHSGEDSDYDED